MHTTHSRYLMNNHKKLLVLLCFLRMISFASCMNDNAIAEFTSIKTEEGNQIQCNNTIVAQSKTLQWLISHQEESTEEKEPIPIPISESSFNFITQLIEHVAHIEQENKATQLAPLFFEQNVTVTKTFLNAIRYLHIPIIAEALEIAGYRFSDEATDEQLFAQVLECSLEEKVKGTKRKRQSPEEDAPGFELISLDEESIFFPLRLIKKAKTLKDLHEDNHINESSNTSVPCNFKAKTLVLLKKFLKTSLRDRCQQEREELFKDLSMYELIDLLKATHYFLCSEEEIKSVKQQVLESLLEKLKQGHLDLPKLDINDQIKSELAGQILGNIAPSVQNITPFPKPPTGYHIIQPEAQIALLTNKFVIFKYTLTNVLALVDLITGQHLWLEIPNYTNFKETSFPFSYVNIKETLFSLSPSKKIVTSLTEPHKENCVLIIRDTKSGKIIHQQVVKEGYVRLIHYSSDEKSLILYCSPKITKINLQDFTIEKETNAPLTTRSSHDIRFSPDNNTVAIMNDDIHQKWTYFVRNLRDKKGVSGEKKETNSLITPSKDLTIGYFITTDRTNLSVNQIDFKTKKTTEILKLASNLDRSYTFLKLAVSDDKKHLAIVGENKYFPDTTSPLHTYYIIDLYNLVTQSLEKQLRLNKAQIKDLGYFDIQKVYFKGDSLLYLEARRSLRKYYGPNEQPTSEIPIFIVVDTITEKFKNYRVTETDRNSLLYGKVNNETQCIHTALAIPLIPQYLPKLSLQQLLLIRALQRGIDRPLTDQEHELLEKLPKKLQSFSSLLCSSFSILYTP